MSVRESHLVELVDEAGTPTGQATVSHAHTSPGLRHRAFSVLLVDPTGRLLLQRRAATKTRFALRWANTCCGHPAPGQPVVEAALTRLDEELGVTGIRLREIGIHTYRAADANSARVEHEYDHVLVGEAPHDLPVTPDPAEVDAVRAVHPDQLLAAMATDPAAYAPWLAGVVHVWQRPGEPLLGR